MTRERAIAIAAEAINSAYNLRQLNDALIEFEELFYGLDVDIEKEYLAAGVDNVDRLLERCHRVEDARKLVERVSS